ncbi:hypothetical protein C8Q77DRAFT_878926 [Trametes polyzona]|nr:hypothetical protein C8Q77DRAFT_878926 [Trametes polyzona]
MNPKHNTSLPVYYHTENQMDSDEASGTRRADTYPMYWSSAGEASQEDDIGMLLPTTLQNVSGLLHEDPESYLHESEQYNRGDGVMGIAPKHLVQFDFGPTQSHNNYGAGLSLAREYPLMTTLAQAERDLAHAWFDVIDPTIPSQDIPIPSILAARDMGAAVAVEVHLHQDVDPLSYPATQHRATLPRDPYTGNGGHSPSSPPAVVVNVAARDAIDPERLAALLTDPLEPTFVCPSREKRKGTFRFPFSGCSLRGYNPKQYREYAAGNQSSSAAQILLAMNPDKRKATVGPLMRVALVEKLATELRAVMAHLKSIGTPLTLSGREVDFDHILIVNIFRPTPASWQPTLSILDEFQSLYCS